MVLRMLNVLGRTLRLTKNPCLPKRVIHIKSVLGRTLSVYSLPWLAYLYHADPILITMTSIPLSYWFYTHYHDWPTSIMRILYSLPWLVYLYHTDPILITMTSIPLSYWFYTHYHDWSTSIILILYSSPWLVVMVIAVFLIMSWRYGNARLVTCVLTGVRAVSAVPLEGLLMSLGSRLAAASEAL
jgi:hypothetical protein